ncbi:MAG: flagellin lysine-N-methylase [Fibrobacter sp.]|nr:flagellin lysine-N-methylase [Fibrobacter sp.]
MLLRVPSFYHQFQCLGGRCSDTCCVGWEVDVDEKTHDKYRDLYRSGKADERRQQFLQKLLSNIEDGHFKLLPGDRCPFLKENGLCEMICEMGCNGTDIGPDGENVLCDICREHPRFVEVYGDIMEKGVGLCCEEAARLLLTAGSDAAKQDRAVLTLIDTETNDEPDEMPEGAEEARDAIFEEREAIFAILNNNSVPLNQRLIEILDFAEATSGNEIPSNKNPNAETPFNETVRKTWIEILNKGESYGPAWDKAYERMIRKGWQQPQSLFSDEDGARIIAYMIFRYYAKSLFDGDSLTKVQFAIYFWTLLKHFGEELAADSPAGATDLTRKINAVKLLSKQTEYSEEIMEILADNFFENPAFCVEQFRRILQDVQ